MSLLQALQPQAQEPPQNNAQKDASYLIQDQKAEQRARDVTGCWAWRDYSDLAKGGLPFIVSSFQASCQTTSFSDHWTNAGFSNASFHPNTELKAGFPAYDKFLKGLSDLEHAACLGVVFHGTATANVKHILRDGLDPNKRKGQAYGPGEYFSKHPSVSVSFCRGGLEMLVFVVVLPSSLTLENDKEANNNANNSNKTYHNTPADYAVVNNNLHQIPIGTMRYTEVNHTVMRTSQTRRSKFLQLSKEVFDKSQVAKEGLIKAEIIQFLIAGKVDVASEKYEKQRNFLKFTSKREISWYVHQKLDEEIVFVYFTELPKPYKLEEMEKAKIQSVDESVKQESEAKQRLEAERQASQLQLQPQQSLPAPLQAAQPELAFQRFMGTISQPTAPPKQQGQQQPQPHTFGTLLSPTEPPQQHGPYPSIRPFLSPTEPHPQQGHRHDMRATKTKQPAPGVDPSYTAGADMAAGGGTASSTSAGKRSNPFQQSFATRFQPFASATGLAASGIMNNAAGNHNNATAMTLVDSDDDNDVDDGATIATTDAVVTASAS